MSLESVVRNVSDYPSLLALLAHAELGWDVDSRAVLDDVTFEWSGDELKLSEYSSQRLNGGGGD